MPSARIISGAARGGDQPVWEPLVDLIGTDLAGWFMWMFEIELADRSMVHAYKHISTRRYFHLGEDGRAFSYTADGRYGEIAPRDAIDEAFSGWDKLLPKPEDPVAVRAALRRARRAAAS